MQQKVSSYKFFRKIKGVCPRISFIENTKIALLSKDYGIVTAKQYLTLKKFSKKNLKKKGVFINYLAADTPLTLKNKNSRMGGGKGNIDSYIVKVNPGKVILEVLNLELFFAVSFFKKLSYKLPISTEVIISKYY
eukprot:GHVL01016374.1.p4 GENE.GHVL01016374.1~~GHVL01016374.1.p4  ORF type:complete len:135 (+),score=15.33 GHVL01016374.1:5070-5474(+)